MSLPSRSARIARRVLVALAVVLGLVAGLAGPASADPPGPTDYRSQIDDIVPNTDGFRASIVGGDGFLLLEVADGTTVEVPGYDGDPYLRFRDDGTVEENQSSPTAFLNQSRTRTDASGVNAGAEPRWKVVATDGRWAWHDHRIHFMGGEVAEAARTDQGVGWEVPMVVDGEEVVITGDYRLIDAPSPLPWFALALVVAVAVGLGMSRLVPAVPAAGVVLLFAGIGGVVAGAAQRSESPPGASTSTLVVILPAIAVIAGVVVLIGRSRVLRGVVALAGAAALGGWALVRIQVLWKALLPTSLPASVDRSMTAVALGAVIGVAALIIRSGTLAPDLSDLDEPASEAGPAASAPA
ncbi:hypothetical protein HC251_24720 (plasmid) [Iamia sp. SCSIO 61187]|uniref:hypothetical protein n=1 Tax=Iamia sp. SCSIO 61187 TaxID=2722752 RepID=UPI001C6297F1|nr:hypothetical protein [Iamia sp. SCSIO 61187]QYG94348.1 hypothetical protein HC251_19200 [Iamia sp. SCSIO 61187]QYG95759.1 hypothetical protein HC251_24720 [Iamia sp. SCSIO 61187]